MENKDLYRVVTIEVAKRQIASHAKLTGPEVIDVSSALARISSGQVASPEDLPAWPRSNMDGFALRAVDTHGASESLPAYLDVIGSVAMGEASDIIVAGKQAASIATGGMLPSGADAVVMVEYTEPAGDGIEVTRPVAPGENVVQIGEDFKAGKTIVTQGSELTPSIIGAMHALGVTTVEVYKRPNVFIISTGDELVSVDEKPRPGQIRDVNTTTLSASVVRDGGIVIGTARVGDDAVKLNATLRQAVEVAQIVLISGGSSVSAHDYTSTAIDSLGQPGVLVHGVSMSPGKPTIIGAVQDTLIFGLSGHPGAALVVYEVFVRPLLWEMQGGRFDDWLIKKQIVRARLDRNLVKKSGRTDFVRVRLYKQDEEWLAEPIFGSSGLIMTLTKSDGVIVIPDYNVGMHKGQEVEVELW